MRRLRLIIVGILCVFCFSLLGACGKTAKSCTVTVQVNEGNYGAVSVNLVENVAVGTAIVADGNCLKVGATEIVATATGATAEYEYVFVEWDTVETVTGDVTVTANFARNKKNYTVSVVSTGAEYGTVSAESLQNVPYGTAISVQGKSLTVGKTTITAQAKLRDETYFYEFTGWIAPETVTENVTVTACFARKTYTEAEIETRAIELLLDSKSYYYNYYHGKLTEIVSENGCLNASVVKGAGGVGMTLLPSAIKELYDLGYKKISFTLSLANGTHCAIFIDGQLNFLSGYAGMDNGFGCFAYYFENGATVTIDLSVLVGDSDFMNTAPSFTAGGLHFVVMTGMRATAQYTGSTTITISEVEFESFIQREN